MREQEKPDGLEQNVQANTKPLLTKDPLNTSAAGPVKGIPRLTKVNQGSGRTRGREVPCSLSLVPFTFGLSRGLVLQISCSTYTIPYTNQCHYPSHRIKHRSQLASDGMQATKRACIGGPEGSLVALTHDILRSRGQSLPIQDDELDRSLLAIYKTYIANLPDAKYEKRDSVSRLGGGQVLGKTHLLSRTRHVPFLLVKFTNFHSPI